MADSRNVAAGALAGGTSGGDLAWFATAGTAGPVASAYTAEVQAWTFTGTGTAGSWTPVSTRFGSGGVQAYNVATGALATALSAAWGITVTVTGTAGSVYNVTYPVVQGDVPSPSFVNSVTGVSAITPTVTTPGAGANQATAAIPAAFKTAGWCDSSGLVAKKSDSSKDITAFGSLQPIRTIVSASKVTFDIIMMETNHTSLEVYHRLPIGFTGVAGADGFISNVVDGPNYAPSYAGIFDAIDGFNHIRAYAPNMQATAVGDTQIQMGEAVKYPVTFTAFPDSNGIAIYWYIAIAALANL